MTNKKINLPIHQHILPHLKEAILFIGDNGEIINGNKQAYSILGIDEKTPSYIFDYLDFEYSKEMNHSHLLIEHKHQKDKIIDVKSIPVNKDVYCLIMSKVSLDEKALQIKEYINDLTNSSTEGVVLFKDNKIIDCDHTFASLFGYSQSEIKEMDINDIIDENKTHKNDVIVPHTTEQSYEMTGLKKDGSRFYISLLEAPYNYNGTGIRFAIVKDITERLENKRRMEFMAYYDELTDLPNRNFFVKVLQEAIDTAKNNNELLAVYFIDLDYFKEINDSLGYAFGDKLLRACGQRLKSFLQTDTFIARMGGDEFLILQKNIADKKAIIDLAQNLISEFESPIMIDDYEIYTSISIGISIFPDNGITSNDLIKRADAAMYVIKEKQRNNFNLFDSELSQNFKKMLIMESDLRKAIKEKQFELHYQPQKNLKTGKVVGMEALLRWKHPERGYIQPGEFIPLAEKTGLIIEIGDWVLKEACRQNKAWQDQGYHPILVSVNLSAKQFHQRNLVEKVKSILTETGLNAEYLELEITESMAMTNEELILKTMHDLRNLGVLVSIDDFGTGYSSFRYLSVFPISKLKIDKMFMNGKRKQNQAIVKSIIHMSHSLNMKVIAEGVETAEQLLFLKNEKCDEMQGFYFSKPLPPEQLTSFLKIS